MNEPYFCRSFFLTDWRHKRLKNKIGLLLFYREHFYGFSESVFIQYAFIGVRKNATGKKAPRKNAPGKSASRK